MKIVTGRGNNRRVFEIPHASVVNASDVKEQIMVRDLVCEMLGVSQREAGIKESKS